MNEKANIRSILGPSEYSYISDADVLHATSTHHRRRVYQPRQTKTNITLFVRFAAIEYFSVREMFENVSAASASHRRASGRAAGLREGGVTHSICAYVRLSIDENKSNEQRRLSY